MINIISLVVSGWWRAFRSLIQPLFSRLAVTTNLCIRLKSLLLVSSFTAVQIRDKFFKALFSDAKIPKDCNHKNDGKYNSLEFLTNGLTSTWIIVSVDHGSLHYRCEVFLRQSYFRICLIERISLKGLCQPTRGICDELWRIVYFFRDNLSF